MARPPKWHTDSPRRTIRVPEEYAERLLDVAHAWDSGGAEPLHQFNCPDCGLKFLAKDAQFEGPLYRFSEEEQKFVQVQGKLTFP